MIDLWMGLTDLQRTIVVAGGTLAVVSLVLGVLWAYVKYGTDFSGVGEWLKSWRD